MNALPTIRKRFVRGAAMVAVLLIIPACKQKEASTSVIPLEGKVDKIVVHPDGSGRITVSYLDKNQQAATGTGDVTPETEIMINGAVASLKDIREGEKIRGEVRLEKKGEVRKQVAVRIHVDRALPAGGDK